MESLVSILRALSLDSTAYGYRRPDDSATHDADTLSASVDLEDIISHYDEPSRESYLNADNTRISQSQYFSVQGAIDEETTSFYSALHDGFSLNEFDYRDKNGQELLWKNNNCCERDIMLQLTHFQISWFDLNLTIKPKTTFVSIWDDCMLRLSQSAFSPLKLINLCGGQRKKKYDVNVREISKGASNSSITETVTILRNVNGSFKSGELTAIMGPSGAGKTSLLNILSRRRATGFTGQVHVSNTDHRISITAIPQNDHLQECLTVRENLMFASRLKTNSIQNHEKGVIRVSNYLGLDECLDTRAKNLSGGQQKRLAIAQELLSRPDILILDEPTSGLDSLTCLKTLSVLKTLVVASRRKEIDPIAIVLTIHQPQQEAFNLFDKVYVMANGGIVIYDGAPSSCTEFIEKYSGLKMPSSDYNPASFLVEIASGEYGHEPIEALARQVRIDYTRIREQALFVKRKNDSFPSFDSIGHTSSIVSLNVESSNCSPSSQRKQPDLYLDPRLAKSSSTETGRFFSKTCILTERCWLTAWRDPKQMAGRILFFLLLPFCMALMMGTEPGRSNACPKYKSEYSLTGIVSQEYTSESVQNELILTFENTGTLFILIYSSISANIAMMALIFTLDMKSCLKEFYNGWYSMNSYIFARIISNVPLDLVLPTTMIALSYVVTGQNTGNGDKSDALRVLITSLAVIIGGCIGEMVGMLFGAIYMDHITTALFASQGVTLPFVLLSGFIARTKNMSSWLRTLTMTSVYKHCIDVASIARYGWNVCNCDEKQFTNREVRMTGVSDELRNFVKYWMSSQEEPQSEIIKNITESDGTAVNMTESDNSDMFQMIAKQISLYNTYGIDVKSCSDIKPYELHDYGLSERDLPIAFVSLAMILMVMLVVLLLVVKLVTSYRTSL